MSISRVQSEDHERLESLLALLQSSLGDCSVYVGVRFQFLFWGAWRLQGTGTAVFRRLGM